MAKREVRVPLTCPLPEWDTVVNPETGKWYHTPWTTETKRIALANHFKTIYVEDKEEQ
jgi:hypothetical protein